MEKIIDLLIKCDHEYFNFGTSSITDTEYPGDNPMYPGIFELDAKHQVSLSWGNTGGFLAPMNRINATITVATDGAGFFELEIAGLANQPAAIRAAYPRQ